MSLRLAVAQINPNIGDIKKNTDRIIEISSLARDCESNVIIFPELSLIGYPPMDLLEKEYLIRSCEESLEKIAYAVPDMHVILGYPEINIYNDQKPLFNTAAIIHDKKIIHRYHKRLLPSYDVFDETRYFQSGLSSMPYKLHDKKWAITICEDIWNDKYFFDTRIYDVDPIEEMSKYGFDILINLSASPYQLFKPQLRYEMVKSAAKRYNKPVIYVNQVGAGNTEIIFDGSSMVFDGNGNEFYTAKSFDEELFSLDWNQDDNTFDNAQQIKLNDNKSYFVCDYSLKKDWKKPPVEELYRALCMGLKDYAAKSGLSKALIGLSGGIDSALTAAIAVRALGRENVKCILMPSQYSSKGSIDDSIELCENAGIHYHIIPIKEIFEKYKYFLSPVFNGKPEDITEENLQARIRGMLLMAISNKNGHLLLCTSNKSESAVGYATLYGDMAGGLAVIMDLYKTWVYDLGRYINKLQNIIPENIFIKPPSAELKPDQKDEDSLPPYDILDEILYLYLEENAGLDEIVKLGFNRNTVKDVIKMIARAEYKRKQAAICLRVTAKSFGCGRRYPIIYNLNI